MREENFILLVEDNSDDIILTMRALRKNNIVNRIDVVRDGQEAIDYFVSPPESEIKNPLPAFVLLDLKLPKIDGVKVLKMIRGNKRTKLLPVIVLTTSNAEIDILNCYESGANSYVRKPIGFKKFEEAVKQLGLYWLLVNETAPSNE